MSFPKKPQKTFEIKIKIIIEFSAKYPKKDKSKRLKIDASQSPLYIPHKAPQINENKQKPLSEALNNVLFFENMKKVCIETTKYPLWKGYRFSFWGQFELPLLVPLPIP